MAAIYPGQRPLVFREPLAGFPATFHGQCCMCTQPIKPRQVVTDRGKGFVHLACAEGTR